MNLLNVNFNTNKKTKAMKFRIGCFLFFLALAVVFGAAIKKKQYKVKDPKGFAFVPMGTVFYDEDTVSVQAFFMSKHEVTNLQYRTFLNDLKAKGDMASYNKAIVDSTKWRMPNAYQEPMVTYYFSHSAYDNYPVVNITREGAELYCKWLSDKWREENPDAKYDFRLPYRAEWIMAARGGSQNAPYPWGGPYLRNSKGCYMCNFNPVGAENIHKNSSTGTFEIVSTDANGYIQDGALTTMIVGHYKPNDYGIFDMSGNVAEMVKEEDIVVGGSWSSPGYDVQIESVVKFSDASPMVGFRPVMTYLGKE